MQNNDKLIESKLEKKYALVLKVLNGILKVVGKDDLKFLNGTLKAVGKDEIDDIIKFEDIPMGEIAKDECTQVLNDNMQDIIKQFGKTKIKYSKRETIQEYTLTVLRAIVKEIGYKLNHRRRRIYTQDCESYVGWVVFVEIMNDDQQ